ncbi:LAGLIDADG family homing endonuclease [Nocardiopsis sp. CNR-923]|uniref:LAGLIDADG family homing endonuclease n=1 Tax=Nocardiopsis sp. CNR-923 TaxID=1904965 RepID=UPI000A855A53|nr:LAGLIDADG family homing endonuclease [Nocardiopsis sp. CNR-923]
MTENTGGKAGHEGLRIGRVHTTPGVHPYDTLDWERRDVVMTNWRDGTVNFEQRGVEFPAPWSMNATQIVASKYFRGAPGTPEREWSLKQLVDRVVGVYTATGRAHGYFRDDADAEVFDHELKYALVHQLFSFNSPVWFNVGTTSAQQVSACFILSVDDTMESILDWYKEEGIIFKGGSGAGVNLSRIRSSREPLSSGGMASGPVSFMRGADASAGTIKSGGATRRAAKMVVLDVDHPDIEEFTETKAREEHKVRALRDAGFDVDLGGADTFSVQYQNANNSVRVCDAFMRAVETGSEFGLTSRTTGEVIATVDAKDLFHRMARAAWECADPGIQYDGTIQDWHTNPGGGRVSASNPCFPADQRVLTDRGQIPIGALVERAARGETFGVYTNDVTSGEDPRDAVVASAPVRYMVTGTNEILALRFSDGSILRCTPGHRVWTTDRGWVAAEDLTEDDRIVRSLRYAPRSNPAPRIPWAASETARAAAARPGVRALNLPDTWDEDPDLAHYLGWLAGGGSVGERSVVTVYGSAEERADVLPCHRALVERLTGLPGASSVRPKGTRRLRVASPALVEFVRALGLGTEAAGGVVPQALFEGPQEAVLAFLRGLFDAGGRVAEQSDGTRHVELTSRSERLLRDAQELLGSFGIASSLHTRSRVGPDSPPQTREDGRLASGGDGPAHALRITGRFLREFSTLVGSSLGIRQDELRAALGRARVHAADTSVRLVGRESQGFETTYNLTEPRNHSYVVGTTVVANCSEYMSLDDSSCNLASINLLKFLREDDSFDVESLVRLTELVVTAMDISVTFADFPTDTIARTTRAHRQLGIGYANLGALLMATGHAYDSDGGRAVAAAVTSLMTAAAYRRGAELAAVVGPYEGYARDSRAHRRVMRKHVAANDDLRAVGALEEPVHEAATREWAECLRLGERHGWRNAQASLLAPTGTIGFMLDCDTTGIEPDFSLVKFKKLVGGGSMQIVNRAVPRALRTLGYRAEQIEAIVEYVAEHGHVEDAPGLRPEHLEVFDCAMGRRHIQPMGHLRMMAAVQPFLSGAISKTVNVPEEATVADFEHLYFEGWRMGLKALAVYRDNCKVGQPLSAGGAEAGRGALRGPALRGGGPPGPPSPAQEAPERDHVVRGGRRRGLHHRRFLSGRRPGRGVPEARQAGLHPGRGDGRVLHRGLHRPPVRRPVGDLRAEVHEHAFRTGGHDRRPRRPHGAVGGGLHLPASGPGPPVLRRTRRAGCALVGRACGTGRGRGSDPGRGRGGVLRPVGPHPGRRGREPRR